MGQVEIKAILPSEDDQEHPPMSSDEIARALEANVGTVRNYLNRMKTDPDICTMVDERGFRYCRRSSKLYMMGSSSHR